LREPRSSGGDRYPGRPPELDSEHLLDLEGCSSGPLRPGSGGEVDHAGLEMGIIAEKFTEMDMVSSGTLKEHTHSPVETFKISAAVEF